MATIASPTKALVLAAIVMTVGAAGPQAGLAQSGGAAGAEWPSREKLEAFAAAAVAVNELRTIWRLRITNAQSTERADELHAHMMAEIRERIAAEGLTMEAYNRIFTATRADPKLYDEVRRMIEEIQR